MGRKNYARVVIGAGIFGVYAALVLAKKGHSVLLIEQDSRIMNRASFVNQARLHTGLHYPRSFITASDSLGYYKTFRNRFPNSVTDFKQIYAVSKYNSKTTGKDFRDFVSRLGVQFKEIETDKYFNNGMVSHAFEVEEPTFDSNNLRIQLMKELENNNLVSIILKTSVTGGVLGDTCLLTLDDGEEIETVKQGGWGHTIKISLAS
jgi:monoamine oxidase